MTPEIMRRYLAAHAPERVLSRIESQRAMPKTLFCDYGAEFTSQAMELWAYHAGVRIDFSRPGKPTDNAYVESFNGTLRMECLDAHWFGSLIDAKEIIETWRREYNESRPHRAHGESDSDRLSRFGDRMSLFLQTLVLRGICSIPANPVSTGVAMSKTAITSPELVPPVGPFSQAIKVGGFLYFSGQVGQDSATGKVVEGGIVAETECVFRNLSAILKAAGKSFDDVVRAGVFLTSMSDYAAMNGIYAKYFSQPFPARTTIAAAALPLGACVEIELVVKA